jgi:hypothetical protein
MPARDGSIVIWVTYTFRQQHRPNKAIKTTMKWDEWHQLSHGFDRCEMSLATERLIGSDDVAYMKR